MEISNKIPEVDKIPKISVVVPAFNIEEYLPTCIESILAQTYPNIEIILVDDGSIDQTGRIIDNYRYNYPEKIICMHLKNGGVLEARLKGISVASGDWIGFVDGDDEIEKDMYARLINNANIYQADISHCGYQTIVNNGERIHFFYNTGKLVEQDRISGLKDLLEGSFVEPGLCNKLFKKELFNNLQQEKILNDLIRINEDLLMNYLLFKRADKAIYEDFCPYHYMSRGSSVTRSEFKEYKVFDPLKVKKYILDDAESELKNVAYQKYVICCRDAYITLHGKTDFKEDCSDLKKELKKHRDKWSVLGRKERTKLKCILWTPSLYKAVYQFYEKHFQRKIYE